MYKKLRYKGKAFYYQEIELGTVKGFRNTVKGNLFIVVNKSLNPAARTREFHCLLKGKKLHDINGKRVKNVC